MARWNLLLIGVLVAAGCGDDGGMMVDSGPGDSGMMQDAGPGDSGGGDGGGGAVDQDFSMTFRGYNIHMGADFFIRVFNEDGTMAREDTFPITISGASETFMVEFAGIIDEGQEYRVDWYVDVNDNGMYDAPPTDHAWRRDNQVGTATGLTLTHMHDTMWIDIMWTP